MALLEVERLGVTLAAEEGPVPVLDNVSFAVDRGESVGLVGESGCGKSVTALAVMGLLPDTMEATGSVRFGGDELVGLGDRAMSRVRGRRIAMVFQEPMTTLDPVRTIGEQVGEGLRWHLGLGRAEAGRRAAALLARVGLPADRFPLGRYPHELSGGQRQRVVIAMALACGPDILIADEPTTALDVTTQAQILDLLVEIAAEDGMALVMITHDLGVIAEMTDRMMVMYAGRIVEAGPTAAVFRDMAHPYTRGLFAAMPTADLASDLAWGRAAGGPEADGAEGAAEGGGGRLAAIPGEVPGLGEGAREACAFAPRCARADAMCRSRVPHQVAIAAGHDAACFHPGG